jgi:hypothetical protein
VQHLRTGHWILKPATITVYLHDTIETKGMRKEGVPALKERVRKIIADPVEASLTPRMEAAAVPNVETALKD